MTEPQAAAPRWEWTPNGVLIQPGGKEYFLAESDDFDDVGEAAKSLADFNNRLQARADLATELRIAAGSCTPHRQIGEEYCQHGFKPKACVFAKYDALEEK